MPDGLSEKLREALYGAAFYFPPWNLPRAIAAAYGDTPLTFTKRKRRKIRRLIKLIGPTRLIQELIYRQSSSWPEVLDEIWQYFEENRHLDMD